MRLAQSNSQQHIAAAGTKLPDLSPGQRWEEDVAGDAPLGSPVGLVVQEPWVGAGWIPSSSKTLASRC